VSDLRTDDDEEAAAENETSVTGEMIPVIGIEDAARTLLTHTRDTEVEMIEIEAREVEAQSPLTFVSPSSIIVPGKLTLFTSPQNPPCPLGRRMRRRKRNG